MHIVEHFMLYRNIRKKISFQTFTPQLRKDNYSEDDKARLTYATLKQLINESISGKLPYPHRPEMGCYVPLAH